MVRNGMQILETESPHPFFFREKPDWKGDAVIYQR
jgi:hypothetical protein